MAIALTTSQGFPTFPGWRYPPPNEDGTQSGEAQLFAKPEDMPEGWSSHPLGEAAAVAASTYESKTHTGEGLSKFPGWRLPPAATSMAQAELFQKAEDVPEGYTEELVDPSAPPAKAPVKELTEDDKKTAAKLEAKTKAPAKQAAKPLTREQVVARLVAEFGYQANDPDMAQATDEAVAAVLADEEKKKRGNA